MHEAANDHIEVIMMPHKDIPPIVPVTAEEVERRRRTVKRMLRLRKRIGPIGIRADDLLHESRSETER